MPGPVVTYEYVSESNQQLKRQYKFKTLKEIDESVNGVVSFGDILKIECSIENPNNDVSLKYTTVDNNLSSLGRVEEMIVTNSKGQVMTHTKNEYSSIDGDYSLGQFKQSFYSHKTVNDYLYDYSKVYGGVSTKINKFSLLKSSTITKGGFNSTQYFDKHDALTGQVLETRTYASDGTAFKTQTIPAYTLPQYGSGNYSMGSKLDDITNKNMLTQKGMSRTYMKVSNDWKLTGVGVTTWNNNWSYRNISGNQNSPTNSDEKIWRKHRIYYWDGDRDADGAYMDFDESNDDGFNWGVGANQNSSSKWKPTSEITRYNHYSTPIEVKDINGNYTTTKTADNHSKVIAVANAKYTEAFYSGAEYNENSSSLYLEPEIFYARLRTTHRAHTGRYSVRAGVSDEFGALMKTNEHRAGKYKLSVWVHKDNYTNARVRAGGSIEAFNGEKSPAGDWVQLNHYFDLTESEAFPHVTSNSGDVYYDDLRIHPIESTMTSYVYNDFDGLSHIIAPSGLATHYKYDKAGRLIETWVEVLDNPSAGITGGFKKVQKHTYNYK